MQLPPRAVSLVALLLPFIASAQDADNTLNVYQMPAEEPAPSGQVHMGCYQERTRGTALIATDQAGTTDVSTSQGTRSDKMSPSTCATYCSQFKSKMYGLSRGTDCICGNALRANTQVAPLSQCNTACRGDDGAFCGGVNYVNVYGPEAMMTAAASPSKAQHIGCQRMPARGDPLVEYPKLRSAQMTVQMCQDHCGLYQSKYFGLGGAGRDCFCGDVPSDRGNSGSSFCKTACAGDRGAFCGGGTGAAGYYNLYQLDFSQFQSIGQWSALVKFPVVPVAVALLPKTGELLAWSSGWRNRWTFPGNGKTYTSIYNPSSKEVTEALVENTQHDMFCPGISMDADGHIIVSGGSTAAKTSIFDEETNSWAATGDLKIPRGYQSSTLTSDNKVFTIGGSFRGGAQGKHGEIYDTVSKEWKKLDGCSVTPMLTQDTRGSFRADSHAWLHAWKDGYVFQAGPSKAMNWYSTRDSGSVKGAGNRGSDSDAMCGVNVMYDAVAGKILTVGGAPRYDGVASTANAHVLTIGEAGGAVEVEKLENAKYNRGFANGVVLPDGKVFIVGGQSRTVLFSDANPQLFPEMWDPATKKFTTLKSHTTPRNYHSVALLMPDATIFSGGGGLCNGCTANHFDGQFFSPPYLFEADGQTLAKRPVVSDISVSECKAGDSFTITMDEAANYTFSMIRMGTSTHAVNTDQRRCPLEAQANDNQYTVTVPGDAGIALPGYWMLFAVNEAGVPSVAKTFRVAV
ncbi:galactose oxidase [Colletotrichum nymphaeae SA-01]|uniref:Galactose oxidase n=1 Tax=Colletotrichum nymphaeae SA-01 TaxID=1460502 RepID=A0A135UV19_9PEZI|nr:galactose oxidase [Colletotrichum nymphaeae SA-01]